VSDLRDSVSSVVRSQRSRSSSSGRERLVEPAAVRQAVCPGYRLRSHTARRSGAAPRLSAAMVALRAGRNLRRACAQQAASRTVPSSNKALKPAYASACSTPLKLASGFADGCLCGRASRRTTLPAAWCRRQADHRAHRSIAARFWSCRCQARAPAQACRRHAASWQPARAPDRVYQRAQQGAGGTNPVRQQRSLQFNAFAGIDHRLPVQRR
jgi:hypothetical protein